MKQPVALRPLPFLVVLALLASACSNATTLTIDGVPVANAAGILERAESRTAVNPDVEIRCFFVSLDETTEIIPIMRCGPSGQTPTRDGPWRVYGLETIDGGDNLRVRFGTDYWEGWDILNGERLVRPDDLAPLPDDHNVFSPPTGAWRFGNPVSSSVPQQFQACMADAGFIVFGMSFLYDGQTLPDPDFIVTHITYQGHDSVSWSGEPGPGELEAKDTCVASVATGAGVGLESDDGDVVEDR